MSAIITSFRIPITKHQAAQIRHVWQRYAGPERCMLVIQPKGMTAPEGFKDERAPFLHCAILDAELAAAIEAVLLAHREARPATISGGRNRNQRRAGCSGPVKKAAAGKL